MDQKTSNFQVVILIVFSFFIILSVILFSTAKLKNTGDISNSPVVMWGTLSFDAMNRFIEATAENNKTSISITYIQKDSKTFEKDLVEAIADDAGPDIVILPQDMVLKNINKLTLIPYSSYPLRNFKDQFIDASYVYLRSGGMVAIPIAVDPMVMYWNKTHFVNASIINPPLVWDEFSNIVSKLTKKDSNFNILQSGVALGEYKNILHAKDILSMLFIQAGASIVVKNPDDTYRPVIYFNSNNSEKPAATSALTFYTDFANPSKGLYSWNKSLKSSLDSFISAETSIYFGYASELPLILLKNPNINFDVAMVPQISGGEKKSVFAKMYGLAILKSSKNQASAFNQSVILTGKDSISKLSSITNLPPVRKDVLSISSSDAYMKTFYDSALIADTFPDPNPNETEVIFKEMIDSVIVGRSTVDSAVSIADGKLRNIIVEITKIK
jgi:ABC-type glycerol-3-phosphate transport system substrate-binding protein